MVTTKDFFGDCNNLSESYNPLKHPKLALRVKHELEKVKIKKIVIGGCFDEEECFKELTLIINPSYDNYYQPNQRVYHTFIRKMKGYVGHDIFNVPTISEKKKIIVDAGEVKNFEMGCYFKERNAIIIYPLIFHTELKLLEGNKLLFFFLDHLTKWMEKNKIKKGDTSKFMYDLMKKKFTIEANNQINEKGRQIEDRENRITREEENIVSYYRTNTTETEIIKSLKVMVKNIDKELDKQIKEIKKLKFVKSIELTIKGIAIHVGKITINYRKKDVYIGDFTIYIMPKKIKMEVKKKLEHPSHPSGLIHPHINAGGGICFGNRGEKVKELLGKNEFKKLVYFLYLFLKSYNDGDAYNSILNWVRLKDGKSVYHTSEDTGENNNEGEGGHHNPNNVTQYSPAQTGGGQLIRTDENTYVGRFDD